MATIFLNVSLSAQKQVEQYNPEAIFHEGVVLFENQHYAGALECFYKYLQLSERHERQRDTDAKYYEAASALLLGNDDGESKIISFVNEHPTSIWTPKANLLYANKLFSNRKYRDATTIYESIDLESLNETERLECKFKKALCYLNTNKPDKALPLFREVATTQSQYYEDACYYYAHIQYLNKRNALALEYFDKIKESPRYKDVVAAYILQINFNNGNHREVAAQAEEVMSKVDKRRKAELAMIVAESYYQLGDCETSLGYFETAKENTRRSLPREVEFRMGYCKMKLRDYEGAIENFQNATAKTDNDTIGQYGSYYLAQCYSKTRQEKFARNAFLKAYKADFNQELSEDALFNYAKLSFIPGVDPFNEAVSQLSDFIAKHPSSSRRREAEELMIHLLLNSNNYGKALQTLDEMPSMSKDLRQIHSQLNYNLGIQYYNEQDYDKSIQYFTKVINNGQASNKLSAEACYWLADSHFQKKEYRNAEDYYLQFVKMPASEQTGLSAYAYYNFGYLFLAKNDFRNALKEFKHFTDIGRKVNKEQESDAWMRIGDCHFMQRQYRDAINAYSNASKLSSKNADYSLYQQAMGYGAQGNLKSKINSLNILTDNYKNSSFYDKALYETGMAHLSDNDQRAAITSFNRLFKERPRSVLARQALIKIGMLYYNSDQYDQALTTLKQVVASYPNTEESREAVNIIRNIYMETNRTQEFFAYTEKNGIGAVSVNEQDSLTFKTAENFFQSGKHQEAIAALNQYFEQYPEGAYLLKAHHYALASLERTGRTAETLPHLEFIVSQPNNDYTDNALLKLARMRYDAKSYEEAARHYERLFEITENNMIRIEALEGGMKSRYFNKDNERATELARQLLQIPDISRKQQNQADYILGMSLFEKGNYSEAKPYLEECAANDNNELGAESEYFAIRCCYGLQKYDEAESKVFHISEHFSSQSYWVARAFITLSDVYVAKDNVFQAKETLKSIIENYPGEDLKQEAQNKLNEIEKDEE